MTLPAGQRRARGLPQGAAETPRQSESGWRITAVTAAALVTGLALAVVVTFAPFIPARTNTMVAAILLAFALGWALLAVLSDRFSAHPQRWAAVPAGFLVVAAAAALSGSAAVSAAFSWLWPPLLLGVAVWVWVKVRRELPSRLSRWLLYPVIAVAVLASVGGGLVVVRESIEQQAARMPGQLVDVGGHRLHLHCVGSGSPTVVLEPGSGDTAADLHWIAPVVARDTRVCTYDRAGRGFSEEANGPQDGARIAADLRTLLQGAAVPGPYVLAGHSFGGLYVLSFAAQFPDLVAGLVLLDSTAPRAVPGAGDPDSAIRRLAVLMPAVGRLGPGRDAGSSLQETFEGAASVSQATKLTSLDAKPLLVVTADTGHDPTWQRAQQRLVTLSANSGQRIARGTTHQSLVADETDSAAASAAIRAVVRAVRTSRPVASI